MRMDGESISALIKLMVFMALTGMATVLLALTLSNGGFGAKDDYKALFTDASPGPVKYALTKVRPDFPSALRLPMTPPSEASRGAVDAALEHAGLV